MPYITSILVRTDSKELPRWLRKNYDADNKCYFLDAWDSNGILSADVRRELHINIDKQSEEIVYLNYDELLKFADVYDQYRKSKSIFNPQYWELRRAARDVRKLHTWLDAIRPKYSLAWAEFY